MPTLNLFASAAAFLLCFGLWAPKTAVVGSAPAASSLPRVELTASRGPRDMEDLTRQKIVHDYAAAWQTLAAGLERNRAELLNDYFTGLPRRNSHRPLRIRLAPLFTAITSTMDTNWKPSFIHPMVASSNYRTMLNMKCRYSMAPSSFIARQ